MASCCVMVLPPRRALALLEVLLDGLLQLLDVHAVVVPERRVFGHQHRAAQVVRDALVAHPPLHAPRRLALGPRLARPQLDERGRRRVARRQHAHVGHRQVEIGEVDEDRRRRGHRDLLPGKTAECRRFRQVVEDDYNGCQTCESSSCTVSAPRSPDIDVRSPRTPRAASRCHTRRSSSRAADRAAQDPLVEMGVPPVQIHVMSSPHAFPWAAALRTASRGPREGFWPTSKRSGDSRLRNRQSSIDRRHVESFPQRHRPKALVEGQQRRACRPAFRRLECGRQLQRIGRRAADALAATAAPCRAP